MKKLYLCLGALCLSLHAFAANYYVDAAKGNDRNDGRSIQKAFRSLVPLGTVSFAAGDSIILAGGQLYKGMITLESANGTKSKPIVVTSRGKAKATIDAKGLPSGITVSNCNHVVIENLHVTANAGGLPAGLKVEGRFGILITASKPGTFSDFTVRKVDVDSVYYEEKGFNRDAKETTAPEPISKYGWGIRIKYGDKATGSQLDGITIEDCTVRAVSFTGIRFTGDKGRQISNIRVTGNKVTYVGGPGIQGSYIRDAYFGYNTVDHSGSKADSRNWKRGSGQWVWGADNVVIEHCSFTNANGPMDSAGAHIDFNCNNVVMQYNFSANNSGGFIEILGNNHNACYRYNVSVNDGVREGKNLESEQLPKTLWVNGFIAANKIGKRVGPFNTYIYNNTIYVKSEMQANIAIENTASGALIANNIFCIEGNAVTAPDPKYNPAKADKTPAERNILVKNNLFLHKESWPADNIQDSRPIFGDPGFAKNGGMEVKDYIPSNKALVNQGIEIEKIPGDSIGLTIGLRVERDILGNPIKGKPSIGAIQVK